MFQTDPIFIDQRTSGKCQKRRCQMNSRFTRKNHSIDSLAALLLFAMYVLFLLFLMLFGAGNYQASVKSLDTNNNLYTAASYITTKFRQHDIPGMTSLTELQGTQVLCFQEAIEGKDYCTYIYFDGSHLKELFTASDSQADLSMGTNLAQLQDFQIDALENTFYRITLTDTDGHCSSFLLHPGVPA